MSIQSDLYTLKRISEDNLFFDVPIYQRLYVWGDEQIRTLLDDLTVAYLSQRENYYYLGGALVIERHGDDGSLALELIDGQQRFTTLWMMSLVWKQALKPFVGEVTDQHLRPRVSFSIRPKVDEFFASLMHGEDPELSEHPQIVDAIAKIRSFLSTARDGAGKAIDPFDFTAFMMDNVTLVLTRVAPATDLNKLFEVINSRGIQLQHHEILKARLLALMPDDRRERERYGLLWDSCAYMDNYAEKNLRDIARIRISDLYDESEVNSGTEALGRAEAVLDAVSRGQDNVVDYPELTIDKILLGGYDWDTSKQIAPNDVPYDALGVESIISFPLLLQHTLRIWLHRNGREDLPRILDSQLLGLFGLRFFTPGTGAVEAKSFIKLLWEIRYCFDKHVIKWVEGDDGRQHMICRLYWNVAEEGKSFQRRRPESSRDFSLLQSMLYHSQQITTHYWLTPFLAYMHARPAQAANFPSYLRHLDNHLLCSSVEGSLIDRSRTFLEKPWTTNPLVKASEVLANYSGTDFPHYWFYKLEIVLWQSGLAELKPYLRNFRITAKNSVEHISPQAAQPYDSNPVPESLRDAFGNLALVSRSLNSEYSNKTFAEKRALFWERNKRRMDSLKMALIYAKGWGGTQVMEHQQQVFGLLDRYLAQGERGESGVQCRRT